MEKIYSEEVEKVENQIQQLDNETPNKILSIKHDLLSIYLMNLILYHELAQSERCDHPIRDMLVKISILLEKICLMEDKAADIMTLHKCETRNIVNDAPKADVVKKRAITEEMKLNKSVIVKRKREDKTPRLKNRSKAERLKKKATVLYDGNIETDVTRTNKF